MKPWGMLFTLLVVLGAGCDEKEEGINGGISKLESGGNGGGTTREKGAEIFEFDSWACWNNFQKGAWVEFEMELAGSLITQRKTIREKSGLEIKGTVEMMGGTMDQTLTRKPSGQRVSVAVDSTVEWSREILQVGDNELECDKKTSTKKLGDELVVKEVWYNVQVPGWTVKIKTVGMTMTCTRYGTN